MKKITLILFLLLSGLFSGHSQVQVGFGSTIDKYLPFSPYHDYSYSQSIYLASEINASGTITTIQWYYAGTGALTNSQQLVVYMGTTAKTVFNTSTDWEPVSNLTQVYSGGITTNSTPGWKTITLTTPFTYNGTSNLIVAVDENMATASDDLFGDKFNNSPVIGMRSIHNFNSSTDVNPTTPPTGTLSAFIPNIIFGGISQACATPYYLAISNIGITTATVSWQASATAPSGGSDYYVSTSSVYPTATTIPTGSITSGTSANMGPLLPATTYYVWVRNNCGNSIYSSWSDAISFTTGCVPVTVLNQNFDSTIVPNLPTCWSKILRGISISPAAKVQTVNINSFSPINTLVLNNAGSTGEYDVIAVSPALSNLAASSHRLRLYVKGVGALQIGTLNNNTNTAVFNSISDITTITTDMTEYVIPFSGYSGTDSYIGIRLNAPVQSTIYIDNVVWEQIPLCPDVTQLTVPFVTASTATIGWSDGGSETSWDIAFGAPTVTDPNTLPFENTTVSGTYLKTGLTGSTTYKVWVRAVCGGTQGNGAWIGPILFTTDCNPIAAFNETFDGVTAPELPSCWTKILRAGTGVLAPGSKVVTDSSISIKSPPNCVYLKNNGSTGPVDIILVSPKLSTLGQYYRLKFYNKFLIDVIIGTLDSNTSSATFTPFQTVTTINGLAQYVVNFDNYTGTDTYIGIRLATSTDNSLSYSGMTLDNIVWEPIPLCPEVSVVNVPEVTTTSATVNWTSTPAETSWQVAVGATTETDPNTLTALPATSPSLIVGNLTAATSYNVWVRAVCGGVNGNGAWVGPVLFTTACLPVASFSEHFDSVTTPNLPSCWSEILRGGANLSQFAFIDTYSSNTSSFPNFTTPNYVQINPQGSNSLADVILVSPNISTLGQAYRLKFDTVYPATIEVGTLDGNTNAAVFTVFQTITLNGNGGSYVVNFSNFTGTIHANNHIGFRTLIPNPTDFPSYNIDNIVWEPIPLCPDVTQISTSSIGATSTTIAWTGGGSETSWQVAVGETTVTDPNTVTALPAATTSLIVTNLTPSTNYKVWVRSVCGAGYGAWIGAVTFTTECTPVNVAYIVDFETVVIPDMPSCTAAENVNAGFTTLNWETFNGNIDAGFPSKTLRCKSAGTLDVDAWFYTRGMNLTQGQNYTIYYKKGSSSGFQTTYKLKVRFGTSTTPAAMTNALADYNGFTGPGINESVNFTVPATGVYYFGFQDYSSPGTGYIYLDDIIVDVALSNNTFDLSKLSLYPNPVKDVFHVSFDKEITSVTVYNLLGQEVLSKTTKANHVAVDLSKFSNGTYIVKVTSDDLLKTFKVIKQ